jgi:hypothetical protein
MKNNLNFGEHVTSIFRVEVQAKQEISMKQVAIKAVNLLWLLPASCWFLVCPVIRP